MKFFQDQILVIHPHLYRWAVTVCLGNEEIAKDILQDVYVKIFSGKIIIKDETKLKTFLFSIIRNTAIDKYRKLKREMKVLEDLEETHGIEVDFDDVFDKKTISVEKLLTHLSPMQRSVLQLVFYESYTLQETASILNVSEGTVSSHYKRAKEKLKQLIHQNNK